jgi:tRNA pseudouridine55 synthase
MQVPPAFSAVKVDGERAYDLAREGVELELEPRAVTIHSVEVVSQPDADHVELELRCGKGAYVRALVRDLAVALGACGHVSALRRTAVGGLTEDRAITLERLEELCNSGARLEALLPVETALDDIPALALTTEDAFRLTQGRSIVLLPRQAEALQAKLTSGSRTVAAFEGERIVALCEMRAGRLNPTRVFQLNRAEISDVDHGRTQG